MGYSTAGHLCHRPHKLSGDRAWPWAFWKTTVCLYIPGKELKIAQNNLAPELQHFNFPQPQNWAFGVCLFYFFIYFFETDTHYAALDDLELTT